MKRIGDSNVSRIIMMLLCLSFAAGVGGYSSPAYGQKIDFETLPGGVPKDDLPISDQFKASHGVTFGLDIDGDGKADPDHYPRLEEKGGGTNEKNRGFDNNGKGMQDVADNCCEDELGDFFLTMDSLAVFIITYDSPVAGVSAQIWDIDGYNGNTEKWFVEAIGENGTAIDSTPSPEGKKDGSGSLDGKPWDWFFEHCSEDIYAIRISFKGTKKKAGFAFDNFTPRLTPKEANVVTFDWLYDGGQYEGELGIFNLSGMEDLEPGSQEFIAEAVRRVISNSEDGHIVLSDPTEGARFSGSLDREPKDWNEGQYKGVKSFEIKPGQLVTILVPNATFAELAADPGTTDPHRRPLFSLVSSNPAYGMYLGQIADVDGRGTAFAYEDISADNSDKDYNDLIIQIKGASIGDIPLIDVMIGTSGKERRTKRDNGDWFDWRSETELGRIIMEHLDAQIVSPETVWLSADLNFPADITVYSPDENAFGTKGGHIPGATFGTDIDGYRFVKLPSLQNGGYRIVLRSAAGQSGLLTLRKHQGDNLLSETGETVTLEAHGTVKAEVSVSESGIEIGGAEEGIRHDFTGDGVIDDKDIELVSKIWNTCKGNENYDPFFDLDNDGCITVKDIMKVAGSR